MVGGEEDLKVDVAECCCPTSEIPAGACPKCRFRISENVTVPSDDDLTSTCRVTQMSACVATSLHVPCLNPFRTDELWGNRHVKMIRRMSVGTQRECDRRPLFHYFVH
jgi:hypothetical protein